MPHDHQPRERAAGMTGVRGVAGSFGVLIAVLIATSAGGCAQASKSMSAERLESSMHSVLVDRYRVDRGVSLQCEGGARVRSGETVKCSAVSSAGRGYRVAATPPCWRASFDGTIVEGPGLLPPGRRPKHFPTGPSNLPDAFSGCAP